jgi:hypothetical protein
MEGEYNPREIIKNSYKYLHQTVKEAKNILSKKATEVGPLDLDSLLRVMKDWTISNNDTLFNYVELELGVNKKHEKYEYYVDKVIFNMLDNYFMAGIVRGISEYAKKSDPEELDNIIYFIYDLLHKDTFYTIYEGFLKKTVKELRSKEKKSLKDYDYILQKTSNYLTNMVEYLLEDPTKNREQFYKSLLGTRNYYMDKLTESLSKAFGKVRGIFYHDDIF